MGKLYNRLPPLYPKEDTRGILRDFLSALEIGGHNILLSDIQKLPDLLDIDKCPDKFLPLLSELFGYEYSVQIPAFYQRRILKVIVDLYKRKGTKSAVKFIAREISGFEAEIVENTNFESQDIDLTGWWISYANARKFLVKLIAPENTSDIQLKRDIAEILINQFIPTNSEFFLVEAYFFADDKTLNNNEDSLLHAKRTVDRRESVRTLLGEEMECCNTIKEPQEIHTHQIREDGATYLNSSKFKLNDNMILNAKGGFMRVTNTSNSSSYTVFD